MEDEKASRNIFEVRNKHITNTVTIDLHGQHVQQAMKLLKVHMMICICMPCECLTHDWIFVVSTSSLIDLSLMIYCAFSVLSIPLL
jgi:hypothetical protein